MRPNTLMLAVILPVALVGCATGSLLHLNDPVRSQPSLDVANLLPPREIPYETQEQSGIAVSYNLFFVKQDNFSGYRLTLIFRNTTDRTEVLKPAVLLRDASGMILWPNTYADLMSVAAMLAGTAVPPIPVTESTSDRYYHQGTISSPSGRTYTYSGTTTSAPSGGFAGGFASGLAQGMALGVAARAARDREEGLLMLRWGSTYWLKEQYTVPPKSAVAGALFFSSPALGNLPLSVFVAVDQGLFEFKTVASGR